MLSEFRSHTTLPAQDLERARAFYAQTLGFTPVLENPGGSFYEGGEGTRFFVFKSEGRPSGDHTQMGFSVSRIEQVVAELRERGVQFEGDVNDLGAIKNAFFRDSEGNLVGLVEFMQS